MEPRRGDITNPKGVNMLQSKIEGAKRNPVGVTYLNPEGVSMLQKTRIVPLSNPVGVTSQTP